MTTTKEHVSMIIDRTFRAIQDVFEKQKENGGVFNERPLSRIIFPQKRNEPVRISEQELRFIFVEQLNKEISNGWDVFYSVETPTKDTYRFKDIEPQIDPNGQSASFDLVIHDKDYKRIALIEFKANNSSEHEHIKDFVKLLNPAESEGIDTFFVEIVNGTNKRTIIHLKQKTSYYTGVFRCWSFSLGREITEEIAAS